MNRNGIEEDFNEKRGTRTTEIWSFLWIHRWRNSRKGLACISYSFLDLQAKTKEIRSVFFDDWRKDIRVLSLQEKCLVQDKQSTRSQGWRNNKRKQLKQETHYKPLAKGLMRSRLTKLPPIVPSPKTVTRSGSPPNEEMLSWIHWRMAMISRTP